MFDTQTRMSDIDWHRYNECRCVDEFYNHELSYEFLRNSITWCFVCIKCMGLEYNHFNIIIAVWQRQMFENVKVNIDVV